MRETFVLHDFIIIIQNVFARACDVGLSNYFRGIDRSQFGGIQIKDLSVNHL